MRSLPVHRPAALPPRPVAAWSRRRPAAPARMRGWAPSFPGPAQDATARRSSRPRA